MGKMRFHTLQDLQTLWGGGGMWMLDELPNLSESVQKLHIEGIETLEQLEVAFRCPSIMFDRLRTLYLDWLTVHCNGGGIALKKLDHIMSSRHLRKLGLRGRIEDALNPFQFPFGIKKLGLVFTQLEEEATLEALGRLPNLKVLDLSRNSYLGRRWICVAGMFPQLKELMLLDLPNLLEWSIEKGAMCRLEKLRLWQCEQLQRIPEGVKFITTLEELEFNAMTPEFYNKIKGPDGEDGHVIEHVSVVRYLD